MQWTPEDAEKNNTPRNPNSRAEMGKTELSLMHFTVSLTHESWDNKKEHDELITNLILQLFLKS